jgi:hypothetical protein
VDAAVDKGRAGLVGAVDGAVLDGSADSLTPNGAVDSLVLGRVVGGDGHVISPLRLEALVAPVTVFTPSILGVLDNNGFVGLTESCFEVSTASPEPNGGSCDILSHQGCRSRPSRRHIHLGCRHHPG